MADKPIAEKWADRERVLGSDPRDEHTEEPDVERADHDLLIHRPDLGEDAATFVAEGDPIPRELAGRPRRRAASASRPPGEDKSARRR
jgi:hypothetical protein